MPLSAPQNDPRAQRQCLRGLPAPLPPHQLITLRVSQLQHLLGLLAVGGLLLTATTGSPSAALIAVLGAVAWLGGHWLFAVRNHYYASPLARRVFNQALPRTLNTARRWGTRVLPVDRC
jgi:hypothetical protein